MTGGIKKGKKICERAVKCIEKKGGGKKIGRLTRWRGRRQGEKEEADSGEMAGGGVKCEESSRKRNID